MKYLVKKSNPIQNHSCFLKKWAKMVPKFRTAIAD